MALTTAFPGVPHGPRCGPRGAGPCPRHRWEGSRQLKKYETRSCVACGGRFERTRTAYRVLVPPTGTLVRIGRVLSALPPCPARR